MDVKLLNCFLSVDDHDKAIAFYRDALGFEVRNDVRAYGMRWTTVGPPSQPDVSIVLEPPAADPGISPLGPGGDQRPARQGPAAGGWIFSTRTSTASSTTCRRPAPRWSRSRWTSPTASATAPSAIRPGT